MRRRMTIESMLVMIVAWIVTTVPAWAQTTSLPWEGTLQTLFNDLGSATVYYAAGIAIIIGALVMAFIDIQGGAKRAVQAVIGLSIAVGAASIIKALVTNASSTIIPHIK